MQKPNLQKTHSNKSIWRILESIRVWFTKSSKEKSMLSNPSTSPPTGQSMEELILVVPTPQPFYGLRWTMTKISLLPTSITKQGKQLIITLDESTAISFLKGYHQLM